MNKERAEREKLRKDKLHKYEEIYAISMIVGWFIAVGYMMILLLRM